MRRSANTSRQRSGDDLTNDTDICCEWDRSNLERLAAALQELEARLRGRDIPDDVPFTLDAETLARGQNFTYETAAGPLDVLGARAGVQGFADLIINAEGMELASDLSSPSATSTISSA